MKWFALKKAVWPVDKMPKAYFSQNPNHPDLGAVNEIMASMAQTLIRLECDLENLERRVHNLEGWP